jgi:hypothetical protein
MLGWISGYRWIQCWDCRLVLRLDWIFDIWYLVFLGWFCWRL